jgi:DNA replication protein DnaD
MNLLIYSRIKGGLLMSTSFKDVIRHDEYDGTIYENGYGKISQNIMRCRDVSISAKALYSYFCSFAGNKESAFPSWSTICDELNISRDSYSKYLNELKMNGFIYVEQEKTEQGKFSKNIYYIITKKNQIEQLKTIGISDVEPMPKKTASEKNRSGKKPVTDKMDSNINRLINNINIKEEEEEKVISIFNDITGLHSKYIKIELLKLKELYGELYIIKALDVMGQYGGKSIKYLKNIIKDWQENNLTDAELVNAHLIKRDIRNKNAKDNENKIIENKARKNVKYNTKENSRQDRFNNFEQRTYNFDTLEKKLLGWDIETEDPEGM